jgi:MFS family permease
VSSLFRRSPGFRRLWAAGAVSLVGDWLSFVAVSALALGGGGGAIGLAIVLAGHALPGALLAPLAGALVDRFDRRRVLILADALAAAVTVAMALAAWAGAPLAVSVLLFVRSAITSIVPPGESAAIRRLVGEADLVRANAILAATWSVAFVAGMALGGAAAMLGPALAIAIDAATFAVAALLHATLPPMPVVREDATRNVVAILRAVPRDTRAALAVAVRHRALFRAVLGKAPVAFAAGAGWIALNLIGSESLPFGPAALSFGVLQALRGAGTGLGPWSAGAMIRRGVATERTLAALAVGLAVVAIGCLAFVRDPVGLAIVALVWGIGSGTNWVLAHAALQRHAGDAVIGRLSAFDELLVAGAMVASAFVGAWLAVAYGSGAAAIAGAILGVVALLARDLVSRLGEVGDVLQRDVATEVVHGRAASPQHLDQSDQLDVRTV